MNNFTAHVQISINAPATRVWEALTDPKLVKQYMFGADMTSSWEAGSPIVYRGEYEGKPYEEKHVIVAIEPGKRLVTSYINPAAPDDPSQVVYELHEADGVTTLSVSQDNNNGEEGMHKAEQNWQMVLESIKKLIEK